MPENDPNTKNSTRVAVVPYQFLWKYVTVAIVCVTFMLLFHDAISKRIGAITEFDSRWLSLKLNPGLDRVTQLAKPVSTSSNFSSTNCLAPVENKNLFEIIEKLADENGKGAVMDAFRELELSIIGLALKKKVGVTGSAGRVSGAAAIKSLFDRSFVTADIKERFDLLHDIRREANQSTFSIESDFAKKYICQSFVLSDEISQQ